MSKAPLNTPDEIVTEIIMTRTASRNQAILVVEGSSDKSLLSNHIFKECKIIPTNGKDKILAVFVILEKRPVKGVLGIIDADFAHLEMLHFPQNLFLTDTSDLETLLLSSPALEKALYNTISPELDIDKICTQLRKHALELASIVAYLRWVDYKNRHYNIRFDEMSFEKLIDLKKFHFNEDALILALIDKDEIREKVRAEITILKAKAVDLWVLCRGKDVLGIIAIILPQITKSVARYEMSDKQKIQTATNELSRMLRIAYELDHFKETKLYQAVKVWEQANPPFVVFK